MSSFVRRLKYYGIGFSIGIIFVFFFFKNRGCSWLPDNRVKNAVLERVIVLPESQEDLFKSRKLTTKKLLAFLNEGDVSFSESDKSGVNKRYKIDYEEESLYFTLPDESFVSAVYFEKVDRKQESHGKARAIQFPVEKHLVYVDSTQEMECFIELKKWQKVDKIQKLLKKKMVIDFDQSQFVNIVKPVHRIIFKDEKGTQIEADAIWYKNKINITKFVGIDTLKCN